MVKKDDCRQSNDSNSSLSSNSSNSSFVNNFHRNLIKKQKNQRMQNLANQLVAAAVGNGNPILCAPSGQSDVAQVYFPSDLSNQYKLQAAVHLMNQAAQQHQNGSKELVREKRTDSRPANSNISSSSSSGSNNGSEIVEIAQETNRKREIRLLKNREAARECRRKKKEYIKCLENRVAVLETQNKTLIEELKTLKELYCQTGENTNSNKNSSNSHSSTSSQHNSAVPKA